MLVAFGNLIVLKKGVQSLEIYMKIVAMVMLGEIILNIK